MSEKADLLAGADAEFVRFNEVFGGLSETEMSEVWGGTCSARDIAGWRKSRGI